MSSFESSLPSQDLEALTRRFPDDDIIEFPDAIQIMRRSPLDFEPSYADKPASSPSRSDRFLEITAALANTVFSRWTGIHFHRPR